MTDADQSAEPKALARTDEGGVTSIYSAMSVKQIQAAVDKQKKQREVITAFVKDQLVKDIDFGVIPGTSKPTLYKPGQEKIFSLFGLTATCQRDDETLQMLGDIKGLVAYKCIVYKNQRPIAEGRGACVVGEGAKNNYAGRDVNTTIKIAEKRARMDACLSLGFSEFFTQDLDDMDLSGSGAPAAAAPARPASDKQKKLIYDKLRMQGIGSDEQIIATIKANGIADPTKMTMSEASALIDKLINNSFIRPDEPEAEVPPAGVGPGYMGDAEAEIEKDETVYIDDQYKEDVEAKMRELKLTAQQRMRVLKSATGKVTAPKTDDDWIALSKYLDAVAAGEEEIDG